MALLVLISPLYILNNSFFIERDCLAQMLRSGNYLKTRLYRRWLSSDSTPYKLTCGLEVHTQLHTENKLFSLSKNDAFESLANPNFHTSYFDIALPGTQPKLNYSVVLFALKLALSLDCDVNLNSQFDRKHYFYGDQPQGYQITQHYSPFAKGGFMKLYKDLDGIKTKEKVINLIQLQIEQDTGRSTYFHGLEGSKTRKTLIDLNRSNVPLIELVTQPDFHDTDEVRAFIKKYQNLVRQLKISTGDLETGSIRVDVNVSVDEHPRVELKNLPNTSSIINAIKFEHKRQADVLKSINGDKEKLEEIGVETRTWDGSKTLCSRSKESAIDYRYVMDPELPCVTLHPSILNAVKQLLPKSADEEIKELMEKPYSLSMKDAKILVIQNELSTLYNNEQLRKYYLETFQEYCTIVTGENSRPKTVINWVLHEFLGDLKKLDIPLEKVSTTILKPRKFAEFLKLVHDGKLSNATGKLLLFHILENFKESNYEMKDELNFEKLIEEYGVGTIEKFDPLTLDNECLQIINELNNPAMIEGIVSGKKKNSIKFLIGLGMRKFRGRIKPQELEEAFKRVLHIKW